MKKTLILISIFMIRLISCSGKKSAVNVAANKTVGLPNPVQESTAEEMKKFLEHRNRLQLQAYSAAKVMIHTDRLNLSEA